MIDLRSDTVTQPTDEMRAVIASAKVGDDALGDDPTVREFEHKVAERLGKPAAIYCVSGTMCNEIAIHLHTRPGDEVIIHEHAHPVSHESGAPSAISGVALHRLPGRRGVLEPELVRSAIRPDAPYLPRTGLLMLENTHNMEGGTVWPLEAMKEVSSVARETGLPVHLDGARLWNASVASGVPESRYAACADTVSVCFSKGLGAPVGSVLAGPAELILEAHRVRHRLGGAWRQAGLLAAAASYALDVHRDALAEDHRNARRLAEGLRGIPGLKPADEIDTNIVMIGLEKGMPDGPMLQERLFELGVSLFALTQRSLRAVTHLGVSSEDIDRAVEAFARI